MSVETRTVKNPISLWDSSAKETEISEKDLVGGAVDVAIVGGGFTGLSTALHCAQKGLNAHVLEAQHVGYGGSGRNVGLVNAGVWLPPRQVRKVLGAKTGPSFLDIFGRGPSMVFDLIEQHQIQCEATRTGTIHAAHSPAGLDDLKSRHEDWQELGAPVRLLDRDEASDLIGTKAFYGGLLDERAGTINPMGYCRGLARAARAAGATLTTGVSVERLTREGGNWVVETNRGTITAKVVVLGTNAYTDKLWPGLDKTFTLIHFFQLSTGPLGERAAAILPQRQGLWDTGTVMFSLRRDMENRLIIGSMGALIGSPESGISKRWAQKKLAKLFPDLGNLEFKEGWHGKIAMTPDHLPKILRLDDNVYTPIGYNGRGITSGTIFGAAMADLLSGKGEEELPLPLTTMQGVTAPALMQRFYKLAFTANQVVKGL